MLRKLLIKKNIIVNVVRYSSSEESIRLTNLFMKCNKSGLQESGEIINMSNDAQNLNIPRANDLVINSTYLQSDMVNASLNERAALDLSSNMYANTPEPPNEAINKHDRPYDSIMSLGGTDEKNEKYISEELMTSNYLSESQCPRELSHDHMMSNLYISNEERFGIQFIDNANEKIACGEIDIELALKYQYNIMEKVNKYWHRIMYEVDDDLDLFIQYPSENNENVREIIKLYRILNIDKKEEYLMRFNNGQLPLVSLVDKIDRAIRLIVDQWRSFHVDES